MGKRIVDGLTIGVFLLGVYFLCKSLHAEIPMWEYEYYNSFMTAKVKNIPELHEQWTQELKFHKANGIRCYEDAKSKCWWCPDISERDRARKCFTVTFASIGGSTPSARLVSMISAYLLQYGLDCMDEWEYIEDKLRWSEYHFDMCEHYENLLRNT